MGNNKAEAGSTSKLEESESTKFTRSCPIQLKYRNELWGKFKNAPLPEPELERNLGLFIRGSLLARFLATDDVYKRIVNVPGNVMDFGCWRGQSSILCENLRAIHEPFNKYRRIVAFDTFEGYSGVTEKDAPSANYKEGSYAVETGYAEFLHELLQIHEGNNALPHVRGMHRVVSGDITKSLPDYLKRHPETIVALAFFDLGLYQPTKEVLQLLLENGHVMPGSILVFYQLTHDQVLPGDSIAFQEIFRGRSFKIEQSKYYPSMSIVTVYNGFQKY